MDSAAPKIGLLGLGEMGGGLARAWTAAGCEVIAALPGRGNESLARAAEAGVRDVGEIAAIAREADIVFSVLPPAVAEDAAAEFAAACRDADCAPDFVEANAISPSLARRIAAGFAGTGARFVDAGLIGPPPSAAALPRLYASGPASAQLDRLNGAGFMLRRLGGDVGAASGFKMTYAAVTKGTSALLVNALLAAEAQGFLDAYLAELRASQPAQASRAAAAAPALPADAGRWVREMEEIAATMRDLGLPGGFHDGAAKIMRVMDASPFGGETRRTRDRNRTMEETIRAVAAGIAAKT